MYVVWYFLFIKFIFNYVLNKRRKTKPDLACSKVNLLSSLLVSGSSNSNREVSNRVT